MTGIRKIGVRAGGLLWAAWALAAAAPAWADGASVLADAVARAWDRQAEAAALPAREEAARAFADWAAGWTPGAPALSLGQVSDRLNRNDGKREWEIELAVPLWLPGEQAARRQEGDDAVALLAARREALQFKLAGEVREAWWALAAARLTRERAEVRREAATQLLDEVERRFRAGDLARLDVNQVRSEALDADAELADAEQGLAGAVRQWQLLTGLPAPAQTPAEEFRPAGVDVATRLARHPQMQTARAARQLARSRAAAAQEKTRASPELAVRWIRDRSDFAAPEVNTVGVKLTIPFASASSWRQDTSAARAELAERDAELTQVERALQTAYDLARQQLDRVGRQRAAAEQQRRLSDDSRALAEKAFALGEADLATLLRLRTASQAAALRFLQLDIARGAAQSRLRQALGEQP